MNSKANPPLNARKTPLQARSAATVEAISEATIQVLLSHGADRLTTTRVAERAGVSIGTLYQYYPNKQSLLFALLEQKLEFVTLAVESACSEVQGRPIAEMLNSVVARFIDAKMLRPDISAALYRISTEVNGPALVMRMGDRTRTALHDMLASAPDAPPLDSFAVETMYAAMSGVTRMVLENGATPKMVQQLRVHLTVLCRSYILGLAR